MYYKMFHNLYWNIFGAIIILPININAFSDNSRIRNATNPLKLQLNVRPIIPGSNAENLTIFELVMVNQLQKYAENSIGILQFHEPFWISTSFLINLLDSSQWSLPKAKRKIQKAVNWRNNNEDLIEQLPNQKLYDYYDLEIKGYDKEGCPVVIMPVGLWRSYRSYLEKIKSNSAATRNLKIYFLKVVEKILRQMRNKSDSDCSQFALIADMEHYYKVHNSGVKFFIEAIRLFDTIYPGLMKIAYFINSSGTFLHTANTYKSRIPWDLKRKSFIYTEKTFWKKALLENIDESQLAPKYGGTNFFFE